MRLQGLLLQKQFSKKYCDVYSPHLGKQGRLKGSVIASAGLVRSRVNPPKFSTVDMRLGSIWRSDYPGLSAWFTRKFMPYRCVPRVSR